MNTKLFVAILLLLTPISMLLINSDIRPLRSMVDELENEILHLKTGMQSLPPTPVTQTQVEAAYIQSASNPAHPITDAECETIARICWGEARGEGLDGMAAVARVVLNRWLDGRFGSTLEEVCTPGQFHGLKTKSIPGQDAYEAVSMVFDHGERAGVANALYFCRTSTDSNKIKKGLVLIASIGNHSFYVDR